jgi:hypothetical protein
LEAGWLARLGRKKKDFVRRCGGRNKEGVVSECGGFVWSQADADSAFEDAKLDADGFSSGELGNG